MDVYLNCFLYPLYTICYFVIYFAYMSKESFSQRINIQKEKIELDRQIDIIKRNTEKQKEAQRNHEIEIENEIARNERMIKTKENFRGTGIIEAFEEIRDNKILIGAKFTKTTQVKKLFKSEYVDSFVSLIPAKIKFDIEEVSLRFNFWYSSGGDYEDPKCCYQSITVKKIDSNNFKLSASTGNMSWGHEKCDNTESTIDNIAKHIAQYQSSYDSHRPNVSETTLGPLIYELGKE